MRALTFVMTILAACDNDPEGAIIKAGGKGPILCLRVDKESDMFFCRDVEKKPWVCSNQKGNGCVALDRVKTVLDGVLLEKPLAP